MRILRLARDPGDKRMGIFASGVVSIVGAWRIAVYLREGSTWAMS
jgi:hypothetical protein